MVTSGEYPYSASPPAQSPGDTRAAPAAGFDPAAHITHTNTEHNTRMMERGRHTTYNYSLNLGFHSRCSTSLKHFLDPRKLNAITLIPTCSKGALRRNRKLNRYLSVGVLVKGSQDKNNASKKQGNNSLLIKIVKINRYSF